MGMAAILDMWPGPFEQTFVSLSHGDSIWILTSIGPVVSAEKKMFKECGRQTDDGGLPILSVELKSQIVNQIWLTLKIPIIWLNTNALINLW